MNSTTRTWNIRTEKGLRIVGTRTRGTSFGLYCERIIQSVDLSIEAPHRLVVQNLVDIGNIQHFEYNDWFWRQPQTVQCSLEFCQEDIQVYKKFPKESLSVRRIRPKFTHPVFQPNFAHSYFAALARGAAFTSNVTCWLIPLYEVWRSNRS